MPKPKKSAARAKKPAARTKTKANTKAYRPTGAVKAPPKPASAVSARTRTPSPSVSFACAAAEPRYVDAPAGLVDIVSGMQAFAGALPRGKITIIVEPEE